MAMQVSTQGYLRNTGNDYREFRRKTEEQLTSETHPNKDEILEGIDQLWREIEFCVSTMEFNEKRWNEAQPKCEHSFAAYTDSQSGGAARAKCVKCGESA